MRYRLKWNKIKIFVIRVKFDDQHNMQFTLSKPCVRCASVLKQLNIKQIWWSTDTSFDVCRPCELESDHVSRKFRK